MPEGAAAGPAGRGETGPGGAVANWARGSAGVGINPKSGGENGLLIFPSIGGGVCSRSRRRQRQPNHGAGKRGGGTKPKPGATTGGRRRPDRPSCGLLNPPYCLRFLSLTSLVYASLQSKSAFSLQIRYRFLSLGVYFSLCFGGLVACLPGHAVTLKRGPACYRGGSCS